MKNSGVQDRLEPTIVPRSSHNVSRDEISSNALKVLYRLNKAGFQAFLVGGCVRDAMLDLHPKDFDVVTDAHPDEIKALFGNCRLIGRRFRLAHVRFGQEIIEVATFRAAAGGDEDRGDVAHDTHGRILRDNVYGSIGEDVWRRDFTCNALYYNIADFSIWDYVGGVRDIERRKLVLIGDPETRLREDPVRMLRGIRFAAKLGFDIDHSVVSAMQKLRDLLSNVPPARLFDEFLKMFQGGFAGKTFELLWKYELFGKLFPETDAELEKDRVFGRLVQAALISTDQRVAQEKTVTPMFLLGVFLWAPIKRHAAELRQTEQISDSQSLAIASHTVAGWQQSRISIPRRYTGPMAEMLALQPRFENNKGRRALNLLEHKRFRAAYDFMKLRAEVGDFDRELADFWTQAQIQSAEERLQSFDVSAKAEPRKRRRRSKRGGGRGRDGNRDQ